jgi:hypothetical protein
MTIHNWLTRRTRAWQAAYKIFGDYFASRVEIARNKIRDGGEIAEIECLVSPTYYTCAAEIVWLIVLISFGLSRLTL